MTGEGEGEGRVRVAENWVGVVGVRGAGPWPRRGDR